MISSIPVGRRHLHIDLPRRPRCRAGQGTDGSDLAASAHGSAALPGQPSGDPVRELAPASSSRGQLRNHDEPALVPGMRGTRDEKAASADHGVDPGGTDSAQCGCGHLISARQADDPAPDACRLDVTSRLRSPLVRDFDHQVTAVGYPQPQAAPSCRRSASSAGSGDPRARRRSARARPRSTVAIAATGSRSRCSRSLAPSIVARTHDPARPRRPANPAPSGCVIQLGHAAQQVRAIDGDALLVPRSGERLTTICRRWSSVASGRPPKSARLTR